MCGLVARNNLRGGGDLRAAVVCATTTLRRTRHTALCQQTLWNEVHAAHVLLPVRRVGAAVRTSPAGRRRAVHYTGLSGESLGGSARQGRRPFTDSLAGEYCVRWIEGCSGHALTGQPCRIALPELLQACALCAESQPAHESMHPMGSIPCHR